MPTPNQYKGTLIGSTIRPFSDQIKIATALSNEIKGGVHSVANVSERNAILAERRQFGMLVYVIDQETYYQLSEVVSSFVDNNNNWRSVNIESRSTDQWRDNVIDYTGTQPGTPSVGDKYLVTNPLTYDWAGNDTKIAEYTNLGWEFTEPVNGFTLKVDTDPGVLYIYEGDYPYGIWENYNLNPPIAATGVHVGLSGSQTVLSLDLIAGSGVTFNYVGKSIELQASGSQGPTGPAGAVFNESGNIEASSTFSNAKGGQTNSVCFSLNSTIIGGVLNEIRSSCESTILGGGLNKIRQFNTSTILGGAYNCAYNTSAYSNLSTIIGGYRNHICYSSNTSIISSSSLFNNNLIYDSPGTDLIGHKSYNGLNIVNSQDSIVLGGYSYTNYMCTSNCSVMLGGVINNMNCSAQTLLIGGVYNCVIESIGSSILDGQSNCIIGTSSFTSISNSILNGNSNKICQASRSTIISGKSNTIKGKYGEYSDYSSIISGNYNNIIYSNRSIIVGGATNSICNSPSNAIFSGQFNYIGTSSNACNSIILGGCGNTINNSNNSAIIGGVGLTLSSKNNTVLFCCIGTNYGGSNFFGVTSSDITLSGITTLCVRNGLIVGFS